MEEQKQPQKKIAEFKAEIDLSNSLDEYGCVFSKEAIDSMVESAKNREVPVFSEKGDLIAHGIDWGVNGVAVEFKVKMVDGKEVTEITKFDLHSISIVGSKEDK